MRGVGPLLWFVTLLHLTINITGSGTNKPSPSGYMCGGPGGGHCYAIATSTSDWHPTGVTLRMNTLNPADSAPGDIFFNNELWLNAGFNPIHAWIQAGQQYGRILGLEYFWAQTHVPRDQDLSKVVYSNHWLGPITATDQTSGTSITIVRRTPNTFGIRIVAAESSFTVTTNNFVWSQRDFGHIHVGMELAGTMGAHSPVDSYQPWYFAAGKTGAQPWVDGESSLSKTGTHINPPVNGGWIIPPSDRFGGIWFTSCCVPPTTHLQPPAQPRLSHLVHRVTLTTSSDVVVPLDHPPMEPRGISPTPSILNALAHPEKLPHAVDDGLLIKVAPTGATTLLSHRCADPGSGTDGIPPSVFSALPTGRSLCWFIFAGGFKVYGPPEPQGSASSVISSSPRFSSLTPRPELS